MLIVNSCVHKLLVLLVLAIIAVATVTSWYVCTHRQDSIKTSKSYSREVAQGVRIWNPKAGVDLIRVDSCRIEKCRVGAITLGGFNELIVTNLVLNMPLFIDDSKDTYRRSSSCELARNLGLNDDLLNMTVPGSRRFSRINISGLVVNRIDGRQVIPVFAAVSCRNKGKRLELECCQIYANGRMQNVGKASLQFKDDRASLLWRNGLMDVSDLFCKSSKENKQ